MWEKAKEGRRDGKLLVNVHMLCSKVFWTLFLVGVHVSQIILSHAMLFPSIIFPWQILISYHPFVRHRPSEDLHNMSTQMSHRHCQLITPQHKGCLSTPQSLLPRSGLSDDCRGPSQTPCSVLTSPGSPHPTSNPRPSLRKHSSIAFKLSTFSHMLVQASFIPDPNYNDSDGSSYLLSPVSIPHWAWKLQLAHQ